MRRLPEHYRMAIRLRLWDGLAFTDLGERLGLSEDSARKLFGRAVLRVATRCTRGEIEPTRLRRRVAGHSEIGWPCFPGQLW